MRNSSLLLNKSFKEEGTQGQLRVFVVWEEKLDSYPIGGTGMVTPLRVSPVSGILICGQHLSKDMIDMSRKAHE